MRTPAKNGNIFLHPYKVARHFFFFLTKGCLIKHARVLLVLSPTRNRLPTIASFLSCDSLTPQIRPGRLMTASHLPAHTNSRRARQPAKSSSPTPPAQRGCSLDVSKQKNFHRPARLAHATDHLLSVSRDLG